MLTPAVIDGFRACRVAVVGDALLDHFTDGHAEGLCREGPAPLVRAEAQRSCPGGAANVAANLAALGADVEFVSVVGRDPAGADLAAALDDQHVSLRGLVRDPRRSTPQLTRVRADGQLLVRVDRGSDEEVRAEVAARLAAVIADVGPTVDAIIISDYGRGTLSNPVVAAAARSTAPIVVDARDLARYRTVRPALVKPNWSEAVALVGTGDLERALDRAGGVARHGATILERTGAEIAAVTLDRDGAVVLERGRSPYRTFGRPATETNATGAGDAFLAALTLALIAGLPTPTAAQVASRAAAVGLSDAYTARCTANALGDALAEPRTLIDERAVPADPAASLPALGPGPMVARR